MTSFSRGLQTRRPHCSAMEETSDSPPAGCELLILHTPEAQEWAEYLHAILTSLAAFGDGSIQAYAISPRDQLRGYNFERFHRSQCVVLLLTAALLDLLGDGDLLWALEHLLQPPRRVVVLLCGVAEELVPDGSFLHWEDWSKLHSDDEPAVYIQTVLAAMEDGQQEEVDSEREATPEGPDEVAAQTACEVAEEPEAEEYLSAEEGEPVTEAEPDLIVDPSPGGSPQPEERSVPCSTCLTVQPNRIPCGERTTLYIILLHKADIESKTEVVFSSEHGSPQHAVATLVNEYTLSVIAPDMPPGEVSLSLLSDSANPFSVSLTAVTYYTYMDAVGRHLDNATSPIEFICQAFNIRCNKTESVDNMLTDMLKSRMPLGGLKLFGIELMETDNMSTYQRNEDLPTLLHFAAKYGLRKLTTTLLHCPGALQAYSIMNRQGDYPNTLAERSGFADLRQFMDEFVETADTLSSDPQDDDSCGVYMLMAPGSEEILTCSEHTGEIYESMLDINPECAEDLYEVMTGVAENQNPEEALLRTFFLAKPGVGQRQEEWEHPEAGDTKEVRQNDVPQHEEEEREEEEDLEQEQCNLEDGTLYNTFQEDIYHMVDDTATYHIRAINRPPAPMPRPESSVSLDNKPYIARVFSDHRITPPTRPTRSERPAAEPGTRAPCSSATFDVYSGMKTPGQRQLIALQERVKLGLIDVNEAVQEFKAWQSEHERSNSLRCQQENLNKLRKSINRRRKERKKTGKRNVDLEITAPIQSRTVGDAEITAEYSLYDYAPRVMAPPPPVSHSIQRGNWKTGSTSSTSSTESNRLSTHSILSTSSGTEPDFEDTIDILPRPPRPPRPHRVVSHVPSRSPPLPPHLPPPVPVRNPEPVSHERYISCPTRAVPQRPSAPPVPRRLR